MHLKDRAAIVTGGASGIGRACALQLAKGGATVAVWDLDSDGAHETVELIATAGGRSIAVVANVSSSQDIASATEVTRSELGPVTILVNNAAITGFKPFLEIDEREWDQMLAINLKGPALVAKAVIPDMVAARWGRIVNITSSSTQSGAARMTHYCASKGGAVAFTKSLALEFAEFGITVNNIPPGFVDTPMLRKSALGAHIDATAAASPMRRAGNPEDVAAACVFLCSDAAGYITAQTLGVNGGRNPT